LSGIKEGGGGRNLGSPKPPLVFVVFVWFVSRRG
tara:strand:+ start:200 stop:301 length:102 start_codon:yes stop_codon:yes gene_type:complete